MSGLRWFTKNWANTTEPTHADLQPLRFSHSSDETIEKVKEAVAAMPRWRVESEVPAGLRLTRRTRLLGFTDDIELSVKPTASGSIVHAASRSRVGIGDFGQNRRNILELWAAIRANS